MRAATGPQSSRTSKRRKVEESENDDNIPLRGNVSEFEQGASGRTRQQCSRVSMLATYKQEIIHLVHIFSSSICLSLCKCDIKGHAILDSVPEHCALAT